MCFGILSYRNNIFTLVNSKISKKINNANTLKLKFVLIF